MDLYLQFGYGMMSMSDDLLDSWKGGGVILSPRDLDETQLQTVADATREHGAEPLLDPQCFVHDADWPNLTSKEYWAEYKALGTGSLGTASGAARVLSKLATLARSVGIKRHIVPGMLAPAANDTWFDLQELMLTEAPRHFGGEPLLATVALSVSAMQDEAQVEEIVERASTWDVAGYYIVAESPSYLVDDPNWLANFLILVSGLKLTNRFVLVGYANHQMLCMAATRADAIASGTYQNVRSFKSDKFFQRDEDDVSRRAKGGWYYCPTALSEYKKAFLDVAFRKDVLHHMRPTASLNCKHADALFTGARPGTIVGWKEPQAFRHYLCCLRSQASEAVKATFDETVAAHESSMKAAETLLATLVSAGVRGQDREFTPYVDVNRAAMSLFVDARGARVRRAW